MSTIIVYKQDRTCCTHSFVAFDESVLSKWYSLDMSYCTVWRFGAELRTSRTHDAACCWRHSAAQPIDYKTFRIPSIHMVLLHMLVIILRCYWYDCSMIAKLARHASCWCVTLNDAADDSSFLLVVMVMHLDGPLMVVHLDTERRSSCYNLLLPFKWWGEGSGSTRAPCCRSRSPIDDRTPPSQGEFKCILLSVYNVSFPMQQLSTSAI